MAMRNSCVYFRYSVPPNILTTSPLFICCRLLSVPPSQFPHRAPLAEGLFDALLVLEDEGHDEVGHQVEAGGDEAEVDEAEPDLLGLHVELFRPPGTYPEGLPFKKGLDVVDHGRCVHAVR